MKNENWGKEKARVKSLSFQKLLVVSISEVGSLHLHLCNLHLHLFFINKENICTFVKEASDFYFIYQSCLVIILFTMVWSYIISNSVFSFGKLVFSSLRVFSLFSVCSVFWIQCHLCSFHSICVIIFCTGAACCVSFFFSLCYLQKHVENSTFKKAWSLLKKFCLNKENVEKSKNERPV